MSLTLDLSPEGVEAITRALTDAGVETHYTETDGDTALEVWLVPLDATPVRVLSWRDTSGWRLCEWDGEAHDDPDRTWPITATDLAALATEVARLVVDDEHEDRPDPATIRQLVAAARAAGWRYDTVTPLAGGVERTWVHPPTGRVVIATTVDGLTDLDMSGLTLEEVAGAIAGAGMIDAAPDPTCPQHSWDAARTMRSIHRADQCPADGESR